MNDHTGTYLKFQNENSEQSEWILAKMGGNLNSAKTLSELSESEKIQCFRWYQYISNWQFIWYRLKCILPKPLREKWRHNLLHDIETVSNNIYLHNTWSLISPETACPIPLEAVHWYIPASCRWTSPRDSR